MAANPISLTAPSLIGSQTPKHPLVVSFDIAIISGLLGIVVAVMLLQIWEVARPNHRHVRIVHLIGSAFTTKPFNQQLAGRAILFIVGICYGIFTSAMIYAFELEPVAWIAGPVVSIFLWVLTGVSLTYFRLLHPRIRSGEIEPPGPFALNYSWQSAAMLLIAHLVFGVVCGTAYGTLA